MTSAELIWPSGRWAQDCRSFADGTRMIAFDTTADAGGSEHDLTSALRSTALVHDERDADGARSLQ